MRNILLSYFLLLLFAACTSQKGMVQNIPISCGCEEISYSFLSCDTTIISAKTRMFWQWNCDSSWLTLEHKGKNPETIDVLKSEKMSKSNSIGLKYVKSFGSNIWFKKQEISGCCYPPAHSFYNLRSMEEELKIEEEFYLYENLEENYILYFTDTSFRTLTLYNPVKNKRYFTAVNTDNIGSTIKKGNFQFAKDLFDTPMDQGDSLQITYNYLSKTDRSKWLTNTIYIEK